MDRSLSPDTVAAVEDLEVSARMVVEGMRAGGYRSPFRGPGAEFQQHRSYRAGDDLRHLDWKLYARSDRLFTRQFRETTDFAAQIILDPSASMAYPPTGMTKLRYARVLAASLAYLVSTSGSAVGLSTTDAKGFSHLPPRSGVIHRSTLIAKLDDAQPTKQWNAIETLRHAADLLKRRGVVIVISDFYDDEVAVLRELSALAHRGHDVIMLQVLSGEELAFDLTTDIELEDLESDERRRVNADAVRANYLREMQAFLARCRDGAGAAGVDYALASTTTPPERFLRELLVRRAR